MISTPKHTEGSERVARSRRFAIESSTQREAQAEREARELLRQQARQARIIQRDAQYIVSRETGSQRNRGHIVIVSCLGRVNRGFNSAVRWIMNADLADRLGV